MPISIATASTAMIGIVTTITILIIVVKYRHHPVFKHSRYWSTPPITDSHVKTVQYFSPIFCILELLGLLLSYISVPLFFISSYSIFTCFMFPITFYIGLSLILSTMVSRNYSVYKTVNNVYAKEASTSNSSHTKLLKISSYILVLNTVSLE